MEECPDFMVKMCADSHERVLLPWPENVDASSELTLAEFVVLSQDEEFKDKFELYHRKDKVRDLLEDYIRKKGKDHFYERLKESSYYIKHEKCEALLDNLDSAFDVLKDMYSRFIGFQEGVDESETNPNLILHSAVV